MTTTTQSKLSRLYQQLVHQARRKPGETQRAPLPGGARVAVTINGRIIVSFARKGKRLGDTELITFHHHCGIPARARRIPEDSQTVRTTRRNDPAGLILEEQWHIVGYEWEDTNG